MQSCPVFGYTGKKIVTIDAYKKNPKWIRKNKEDYFVVVTMGQKSTVLFPIDEEGKVDVERGVYDPNTQPKRATFKHEQEERFCLGVAKV